MKKIRLQNIILAFALIMMISSAMVSYFFVRKKEPEIAYLVSQVQGKKNLIKDVWENIARKENKINTAIIALLIRSEDENTSIFFQSEYLSEFGLDGQTLSMPTLLQAISTEKKYAVDHINDLYLEQSNIEYLITTLENQKKLYSDIAFFLQIFSLIIIILRKDTV